MSPQVWLCLLTSVSPLRTLCWWNGEPGSRAGIASVPGSPPVTLPLCTAVLVTPDPLLSPRCRIMALQGSGTGCALPKTHSLQVTPLLKGPSAPPRLTAAVTRGVVGGLAAGGGVWAVSGGSVYLSRTCLRVYHLSAMHPCQGMQAGIFGGPAGTPLGSGPQGCFGESGPSLLDLLEVAVLCRSGSRHQGSGLSWPPDSSVRGDM